MGFHSPVQRGLERAGARPSERNMGDIFGILLGHALKDSFIAGRPVFKESKPVWSNARETGPETGAAATKPGRPFRSGDDRTATRDGAFDVTPIRIKVESDQRRQWEPISILHRIRPTRILAPYQHIQPRSSNI